MIFRRLTQKDINYRKSRYIHLEPIRTRKKLKNELFVLARNRLFANLSYEDRGYHICWCATLFIDWTRSLWPRSVWILLHLANLKQGCNFCPNMCHEMGWYAAQNQLPINFNLSQVCESCFLVTVSRWQLIRVIIAGDEFCRTRASSQTMTWYTRVHSGSNGHRPQTFDIKLR